MKLTCFKLSSGENVVAKVIKKDKKKGEFLLQDAFYMQDMFYNDKLTTGLDRWFRHSKDAQCKLLASQIIAYYNPTESLEKGYSTLLEEMNKRQQFLKDNPGTNSEQVNDFFNGGESVNLEDPDFDMDDHFTPEDFKTKKILN